MDSTDDISVIMRRGALFESRFVGRMLGIEMRGICRWSGASLNTASTTRAFARICHPDFGINASFSNSRFARRASRLAR